MMKILMIGGTGFISGRLVELLLEGGHQVTVFTRGQTSDRLKQHERLVFLQGDRSDEASLRKAVEGRVFDAVYDMIAYSPQESERAVRLFKGKVGRFIHCSTISVYMVSEEVQCPITEEQDKGALMDYFPWNPFGMDYGINKRKCEDILWAAHDERKFPVSMLRPTYVCGPRDPMKRDFFWIERILDGRPVLVPGTGDFAFQNVFVDDVARAFVALLAHPASIGEAYNVVGEEIYSLNDYLHLLSELLHKKPELVPVDQHVFDAQEFSSSRHGDVFPFNTRRTAIFSLDKIKRDLGYRSTPVTEWLTKTIDWYRNHLGEHSTGYENRGMELEFIQSWKQARADFLQQFQKNTRRR